MGQRVRHITSADMFHQLIAGSGDKLVVVDFAASWCGPCKQIGPIVESLAGLKEYSNSVIFVKVDVDEVPELAREYSVNAMPTFCFLRKGKQVERFSGASKDKLTQTINNLLKA